MTPTDKEIEEVAKEMVNLPSDPRTETWRNWHEYRKVARWHLAKTAKMRTALEQISKEAEFYCVNHCQPTYAAYNRHAPECPIGYAEIAKEALEPEAKL